MSKKGEQLDCYTSDGMDDFYGWKDLTEPHIPDKQSKLKSKENKQLQWSTAIRVQDKQEDNAACSPAVCISWRAHAYQKADEHGSVCLGTQISCGLLSSALPRSVS